MNGGVEEEDIGGFDTGVGVAGAAGDGDYCWERVEVEDENDVVVDETYGGRRRYRCSLVPTLPFPVVAPRPRQKSDETRGRDLPRRDLRLLQVQLLQMQLQLQL